MLLSEILRKARFEKDLTIREAASQMRIAVSHLHALERGKKPRPKMEILYKLAAFYSLPIDELCISATRLPSDVFYKIVKNPELLQVIRNYQA